VEDRRRGYAFNGAIALDRLIARVVDLPTKMVSPTGIAASPRLSMAGLYDRRVA